MRTEPPLIAMPPTASTVRLVNAVVLPIGPPSTVAPLSSIVRDTLAPVAPSTVEANVMSLPVSVAFTPSVTASL